MVQIHIMPRQKDISQISNWFSAPKDQDSIYSAETVKIGKISSENIAQNKLLKVN